MQIDQVAFELLKAMIVARGGAVPYGNEELARIEIKRMIALAYKCAPDYIARLS